MCKPGGGLVQHVDAALFVQFAGQFDALAFAARERAQRLAQRQIIQPHVAHGLQLADAPLLIVKYSSACCTVMCQHVADGLAVELVGQHFVFEALAAADSRRAS